MDNTICKIPAVTSEFFIYEPAEFLYFIGPWKILCAESSPVCWLHYFPGYNETRACVRGAFKCCNSGFERKFSRFAAGVEYKQNIFRFTLFSLSLVTRLKFNIPGVDAAAAPAPVVAAVVCACLRRY
jgi:hypothetical protein